MVFANENIIKMKDAANYVKWNESLPEYMGTSIINRHFSNIFQINFNYFWFLYAADVYSVQNRKWPMVIVTKWLIYFKNLNKFNVFKIQTFRYFQTYWWNIQKYFRWQSSIRKRCLFWAPIWENRIIITSLKVRKYIYWYKHFDNFNEIITFNRVWRSVVGGRWSAFKHYFSHYYFAIEFFYSIFMH